MLLMRNQVSQDNPDNQIKLVNPVRQHNKHNNTDINKAVTKPSLINRDNLDNQISPVNLDSQLTEINNLVNRDRLRKEHRSVNNKVNNLIKDNNNHSKTDKPGINLDRRLMATHNQSNQDIIIKPDSLISKLVNRYRLFNKEVSNLNKDRNKIKHSRTAKPGSNLDMQLMAIHNQDNLIKRDSLISKLVNQYRLVNKEVINLNKDMVDSHLSTLKSASSKVNSLLKLVNQEIQTKTSASLI